MTKNLFKPNICNLFILHTKYKLYVLKNVTYKYNKKTLNMKSVFYANIQCICCMSDCV